MERPLENPTWDEMLEADPLIAFSWYWSGRANVLRSIGMSISVELDNGFAVSPLDGGKIEHAEGLLWLWILGAYEVVRTMCQAKGAFSEAAHARLVDLKRELADVRMPAAKMEPRGSTKPINSNRSPAEWDPQRADLLVSDFDGTMVPGRHLIDRFASVFASIGPGDVLKRHEETYGIETDAIG